MPCVALCCSVLQCVAVYCNVLQCVAVCCSVLRFVAKGVIMTLKIGHVNTHTHPVYCGSCSVLQCVATCCIVLQCIADGATFPLEISDAHTHTHTHVSIHIHTSSLFRRISVLSTPQYNTRQHTATHCNKLQHTATHCNTLQHTLQQPPLYVPHIATLCGC